MKRLLSSLVLLLFLALPVCAGATVATSSSRAKYNCNGSVTAFAFTFGVGAASEVQVILTSPAGAETVLAETSSYTVSCTNNDCSSGGMVTTVSAYVTGNTITILRNVPLTQEADFTEGMPTLYETFETGLDKLTRIAQQHEETMTRSVVVPKSESTSGMTLPGAATRASRYLAFDGEGNPIASGGGPGSAEVPVSAYGATLIAAADAPAVRAILDVPPVASIMMYAGASAPYGWLICDGSAVSRTTYAALYEALGGAASPWGQGDGSSTFNLPNFKGRMPVGVGIGAGGGTSGTGAITGGAALAERLRGAWTGAETHTQTTGEVGQHDHSATQPEHSHSMQAGGAGAGNYVGLSSGSSFSATTLPAQPTITVNMSAPPTAMSIMNPVLAVNFIIKY